MDIRVLDDNPLYAGKSYRLSFKFTANYPIEAPEVMFVRAVDRGLTFFSLLSCVSNRLTPFTCLEQCEKDGVWKGRERKGRGLMMGVEIPMHPHIYSNGVICLDLLSSGNGWSPVQSVESVCMSIQSMLTGNTKNGIRLHSTFPFPFPQTFSRRSHRYTKTQS